MLATLLRKMQHCRVIIFAAKRALAQTDARAQKAVICLTTEQLIMPVANAVDVFWITDFIWLAAQSSSRSKSKKHSALSATAAAVEFNWVNMTCSAHVGRPCALLAFNPVQSERPRCTPRSSGMAMSFARESSLTNYRNANAASKIDRSFGCRLPRQPIESGSFKTA